MEFVIREKKQGEKLWKVQYYDCDFCTTGNLSKESFDSPEVAEAYGKLHYNYDTNGTFSFEGVVEAPDDQKPGFMVADANHWGIYFFSNNKERLQKFSNLLAEEGAAMRNITPAFSTDQTICDIDKEWDGEDNINPFYFWYYGAEDDEYSGPLWNPEWNDHGGGLFWCSQDGMGEHFIYEDYELYVEPGYYGIEDANSPRMIGVYDSREVAEAVKEYFDSDGCACMIKEPETQEEWNSLCAKYNNEPDPEEKENEEALLMEALEDALMGRRTRI